MAPASLRFQYQTRPHRASPIAGEFEGESSERCELWRTSVVHHRVSDRANGVVCHMVNKVQKRGFLPPSRAKYEASHPTVSVRVSRDLYDELKAVAATSGLSMADLLPFVLLPKMYLSATEPAGTQPTFRPAVTSSATSMSSASAMDVNTLRLGFPSPRSSMPMYVRWHPAWSANSS